MPENRTTEDKLLPRTPYLLHNHADVIHKTVRTLAKTAETLVPSPETTKTNRKTTGYRRNNKIGNKIGTE
ncbi:hypothetical protein Hanom_Chr11g01034501 [Helianthus anomalus]